jgi:RNA polymerase sigma-70 factor (ECF subfamily)
MEAMTGTFERDLGRSIASAAAGDEIAFGQIVMAYHAEMHRVCVFVCGDQSIAEEAVQNAWSIAWKKLDSVRDAQRLRPWLTSIAVNQARDLIRRRRRRTEVELITDPSIGAAGSGGVDPATGIDALDLRAALQALDPEDRALLAMRYVAGFNATELSTAIGISPSGVRNRLERLTARLREELEA